MKRWLSKYLSKGNIFSVFVLIILTVSYRAHHFFKHIINPIRDRMLLFTAATHIQNHLRESIIFAWHLFSQGYLLLQKFTTQLYFIMNYLEPTRLFFRPKPHIKTIDQDLYQINSNPTLIHRIRYDVKPINYVSKLLLLYQFQWNYFKFNASFPSKL